MFSNKPSVFFTRRAVAVAAVLVASAASTSVMAQAFTGGNLIVSRTVYAGTASTVTVGQALPGGGVAIGDGNFANVFKNETPDPSFGVTSPIYIDQLNTTGTRVSTMAVDSSQITTSFASKSELALNVSSDGKSVSFMGYNAPKNTLDVSNSNTAAVFDSTNPVASTYARAIGNINLSTGAVQVTNVNAYSGNNGRAAVLVNGQYYMVGNAGNGSGNGTSLSQLSDNTGVQRIAVGASGNTTAVGVAVGTYGSSTGYQRGFSLAQLPNLANPSVNYAADKTGKDDNFRGMTVFNNTLYVTKGSGSNGVNTVYQVGAKGALANGGVLDNATITALPGLNKLSEKVAETTPTTATPHPFGVQFINDTTMLVADEGDGVRIDAADLSKKVTTFAGLQLWKADVAGNWSLAQTFQQGLIGQQATPNGMGWLVQQDGLRNITVKDNGDGTYTVYGTTSTVSNELTHDLGADPNEIVSITIDPTQSTAANTAFSVMSTAAVGERFGGLAIAPSVPEPESYALALIGLGLLGAVARRQRQA
jgi:PEP-CTERM motif